MTIIEAKSYVSGPRWAGLLTFIKNEAHIKGIELEITEHEKGWVFETIRWKATGEYEKVRAFLKSIYHSIKEYNGDVE